MRGEYKGVEEGILVELATAKALVEDPVVAGYSDDLGEKIEEDHFGRVEENLEGAKALTRLLCIT